MQKLKNIITLNEIPATSWDEIKVLISKFKNKKELVFYRGHDSIISDGQLAPVLYRGNPNDADIKQINQTYYAFMQNLMKYSYFNGISENHKAIMITEFLQQHHGSSFFLDVTMSYPIATFFACNEMGRYDRKLHRKHNVCELIVVWANANGIQNTDEFTLSDSDIVKHLNDEDASIRYIDPINYIKKIKGYPMCSFGSVLQKSYYLWGNYKKFKSLKYAKILIDGSPEVKDSINKSLMDEYGLTEDILLAYDKAYRITKEVLFESNAKFLLPNQPPEYYKYDFPYFHVNSKCDKYKIDGSVPKNNDRIHISDQMKFNIDNIVSSKRCFAPDCIKKINANNCDMAIKGLFSSWDELAVCLFSINDWKGVLNCYFDMMGIMGSENGSSLIAYCTDKTKDGVKENFIQISSHACLSALKINESFLYRTIHSEIYRFKYSNHVPIIRSEMDLLIETLIMSETPRDDIKYWISMKEFLNDDAKIKMLKNHGLYSHIREMIDSAIKNYS